MTTIIILLIILIIVVLVQYNTLVRLRLKVKQSKSGIDIYLQQRFDLIPNLQAVVKGYIKHEKETFENITKLRAEYEKDKDIKISQELNDRLNDIILVSENYPDLKASEQFLNLQKALSKMESQLQAARRIYNNDVNNYNIKISVVPYNICAKLFGFKEEELFQIKNQEERNNINLDL